MENYKIIFLDIDGTVLRPDDTIEDSTIEAVQAVREKGLEVVLATGRPLHEIEEIGEALGVNTFIGYNGALALHEGNEIFARPMSRESVEYIQQKANEHNHEMVAYTSDTNYLTTLESPAMKNFIAKFHLTKNKLLTPDVLGSILGMTIITNDPSESEHYIFDEDIHFAQVNLEGMHHCFDVIRESVNKGVAVKVLLEHYGFTPENAIAFGDGLNDKEMLSVVGEGFAMGNGHPDLIKYAKHQTSKVTESGIYNGLKKLGLVD